MRLDWISTLGSDGVRSTVATASDGSSHRYNALIDRRDAESTEIEGSVVIPCLNEAETLATCIDKAQHSLERLGVQGEVIVADNGSTDGSQEIAAAHGARVVPVSQRGYGAALGAGIEAARGRWVIMGDADDSYDFSALDPFVERLRAGDDVVLGNRFDGGIAPGAMPWLHRYVGNRALTWLAQRFFGSPSRDIYCGLRGFDRDAVRSLELRSTGMEFALEMVVKATMQRLRIAEVPTTLAVDGRSREPHLRTWRDGWRSLRFFLLYSPNWLFFYPGLVLMSVGAAGMAWRLANPGRVDSLVLLSVTVLIGAQSALFSVLAKVFAITEGLLPPESRAMRWFRHVTLERGLLAGAAAVTLGLGGCVWALVGQGGLDRVRVVILFGTLLALGAQAVLGSFLISILGLKRMGNPVA
jgi:glycosyltransferase involved in cell wall biosynthesis